MSAPTQQELWRLVNPGDSFLPGDQVWSSRHGTWMPVTIDCHGRKVLEGAGPVRRRMRSAEARREYDAALPALLKNMGISSAAESALDSVTGPDGANDIESQRTGKISPNQNGDTQSTGVLPGAAAEDALIIDSHQTALIERLEFMAHSMEQSAQASEKLGLKESARRYEIAAQAYRDAAHMAREAAAGRATP